MLEEKLKDLHEKEIILLKKIDKENKRKDIYCTCCNTPHKIENISLIQTHWYTQPYGCNEGDYWQEGEVQFVCPKTQIRNRLLFDTFNIPWNERKDYNKNSELQFKSKYKRLFKEVIDRHEKPKGYNFVNNFYVNNNRSLFGLVEKKK